MPNNATEPAFDKPEIFFVLVDWQYGQVMVGFNLGYILKIYPFYKYFKNNA